MLNVDGKPAGPAGEGCVELALEPGRACQLERHGERAGREVRAQLALTASADDEGKPIQLQLAQEYIMMAFRGSAVPLTTGGFEKTLKELDVDPPSLWALMTVETRGFGFLPDRRPKILFEKHVFHRRTGGRFSASHPDISAATAGGYQGGAAEYTRLERAAALDRQAALDSASWGLGQIMGFNAIHLGYPSTAAMVERFLQGEDEQLAGTRRFITANPPLRQAFYKKHWARVAFFYNGAGYAKNEYDRKLERYHELYKLKGTPSIELRTAQAWLTFLGYDPRGVDGILGPGTRTALIAFQKAQGLPVTAEPDAATLEALARAANNGG